VEVAVEDWSLVVPSAAAVEVDETDYYLVGLHDLHHLVEGAVLQNYSNCCCCWVVKDASSFDLVVLAVAAAAVVQIDSYFD